MPEMTIARGRWTVRRRLVRRRGSAAPGPDDARGRARLLETAGAGNGAEPSHRPGTIIRDCEVCPELVLVPAGTFRMGDLSGGGDADEGPVRAVDIPHPFAVGRHETTFTQWDACAAAGACRQGVGDIGFGRGERP